MRKLVEKGLVKRTGSGIYAAVSSVTADDQGSGSAAIS
jgi:hypothetical protein